MPSCSKSNFAAAYINAFDTPNDFLLSNKCTRCGLMIREAGSLIEVNRSYANVIFEVVSSQCTDLAIMLLLSSD